MKSRTSFFNETIFKKDITRFAPAWVLYTICLLLGMILLRQDNNAYGFHQNMSELITIMCVINLCYALLVAQLLFGDLYNARMCNAIHALPVTREGLFISHTAAGLAYSIVPTILGTLLALLLGISSEVKGGWHLPLWWLLGTNLQYLFFFGLAAFSALCVGNRFAQAVVYGITNFASVITYWLVDTLYTPMLYGVQTSEEPFLLFSPVIWFANSEYIDVSRETMDGKILRAWYEISDGWGYLAICAVLGAALLVAACLLYRKRNLECAGDFMAVKALEPVFLVVYPLIVAAVFHYFVDEIMYMGGIDVVYLVIGLAIGFFTGLMLLERTIRIFNKKAFLKFAVLAVGFGLTLLVTFLDPFGIVTWIPDADDVVSVDVSPAYSSYYTVTLDDPEEIADALKIHAHALENRDFDEYGYGYIVTEYMGVEDIQIINNQTISLHYHLSNGITKSRYYVIDLNGEAGDLMIPYFNTLDAIFREYDGDTSFEGILNATQAINVNCDRYEGTGHKNMDGMFAITDPEEIRQLLEAIVADSKLGVMAQNWNFRPDPDVSSVYWLDFDMGSQFESITIYSDCPNTAGWLTEHGFISEGLEEIKKFGEVTTTYITG